MRFETKTLPTTRDAIAPDGSDVRTLLTLERGSLAHFTLATRARIVLMSMKVLKESGQYLQKQSSNGLILGIVCGIIAVILYFAIHIIAGLVVGLVALAGFRQYFSYSQGQRGEKMLTNVLTGCLNDDYSLINDVRLSERSGNIDHIVLGTNGIFVIETKNFTGRISCYGDTWKRHSRKNYRKMYSMGSPSRQVKRNAMDLRNMVLSSGLLKQPNLWVNAVLVIVDKPSLDLQLKNPSVPILKPYELCEFIQTTKSDWFSHQDIENIGSYIIKKAS